MKNLHFENVIFTNPEVEKMLRTAAHFVTSGQALREGIGWSAEGRPFCIKNQACPEV